MGQFGRLALSAALLFFLNGCDDAGTSDPPASDMTVDAAPVVDAGVDGAPPMSADAAEPPQPTPARAQLLSVPETDRFALEGLSGEVHVVRTEFNIPHIFAENPTDLARVHGFVMARDRFWMMDLGRRLGKGTLSALFGDLVIGTDITSRARGFTVVGEQVYANLSPARRATIDAFADGVNDYIAAVGARALPPPTELDLFFGLLGAAAPVELMAPWTGADVAAFAAVVIDRSACNRSELENAAAVAEIEARDDERADALLQDLVLGLRPIVDTTTLFDGIPEARHPWVRALRRYVRASGCHFHEGQRCKSARLVASN